MFDQKLLDYLEGFITPERKARFLDILEERTNYITVAIEDVYQMHNTSAVVRSCDVFGVQQAHLIENKFGKRLDKDIAMGAQQWVDLYRYKTTTDCIDTLRQKGYKIVATTPHGENCSLTNFKFDGKTALFFGTERDGLSKEVLEKADSFLKIPMVGFTESLNISVSAAIILQNLTSQLRNENVNWRLTEDEKLEKRLYWTKKSVRSLNDVLARYYGTK
ncbi:TrmH family RNA methyltransferase [Arenibacter troitsensis]|uniref:tRNA (guanosine(18)-2'-O)-methyltransferase n=1 Tax=Arenibacter troitsensis TaxID=188872 RepID=A0A1X7LGT9_9FLAO|nr:RNA methyltransferase [Arenibacter troitsensis]SMG52714.1 tRNA (guanosine-2'-O-)-methyltransferase [Arenibacter troitsensis]